MAGLEGMTGSVTFFLLLRIHLKERANNVEVIEK